MGRTRDLAAIAAAFSGGRRLITVVGPAGVGKTRIASEHARHAPLGEVDCGGVAFVDLTAAREVEAVMFEIAEAVGVIAASRRAAREVQIDNALRSRGRFLLLLDNCEQVLADVAELVSHYLATAPELRILATSREKLRLSEEQVHELGPLSLPDARAPIEASEAVAVWIDRVRQITPGYQLSSADAPIVADIVTELDGMPLAIELCAARSHVLSAPDLLAELACRFDLLRLGARDRSPRQQTLWNAIDWSWELLEPWERTALASLAVFRGGFTAGAAGRVFDLAAFEFAPTALDVVQALRDRSLLRTLPSSGRETEVRLDLYASIREYAAKRLGENSDERGAEDRHAVHYQTQARAWSERLERTGDAESLQHLLRERENILAVAERFLDRSGKGAAGALETAASALLSLDSLTPLRGMPSAFRRLLDGVIDSSDFIGLLPALQARALVARATARIMEADELDGARDDLFRALPLAEAAASRHLQGRAHRCLGLRDLLLGALDQAEEELSRARDLLAQTHDRRAEARCLMNLGNVKRYKGEIEQARRDHHAALAMIRPLGDRHFIAIALMTVAVLALEEGDLELARTRYEEALDLLVSLSKEYELDLEHESGIALGGLAGIAHLEGRLADARALFGRALLQLGRAGDRAAELAFLGYLGLVDFEEGELDAAIDRFTRAAELEDRLYAPLFRGYLAAAWAAQGRIGEAEEGLRMAENLLGGTHAPHFLSAVQIQRGQIDLARARSASAPEEVDAWVEKARARLGIEGAAERSADVRLSRRLLEQSLLARRVPRARLTLVLSDRGRWFRMADGKKHQLDRRAALWALLLSLAKHRLSAPATPLSVEALVAAAWPGEPLSKRAASNRLHVAITRLRKLDLGSALLSAGNGYLLSADVRVRFEAPRP